MIELSELEDAEDAEPRHYSNYQGKGHRNTAMRKSFISWDGEGTQYNEPLRIEVGGLTMGYVTDDGEFQHVAIRKHVAQPQPYVLLAHSRGDYISDPSNKGLSTHECLEFLLNTAKKYPDSIHVGFSINYDINQILADMPAHQKWMIHGGPCPIEDCDKVHEGGHTMLGGYYIKWVPRKFLIVSHRRTKRKIILYDGFSFFGKAFSVVCDSYLGEDHPQRQRIQAGKAARELFTIDELDDFIIPYNAAEVDMFTQIMTALRSHFHQAGIVPDKWYGPGAVASATLKKYNVRIDRSITPQGVENASQFAFAGGWFEQFRVGRHAGTIYENDIHSAYPAALVQLPDLSDGNWVHVEGFQPDTFGVWAVHYDSNDGARNGGTTRPEPLFCRSENGSISHPHKVQGWYWTPEASAVPDCVREGWIFQPNTDTRPFAFIEAMYEQRRVWKCAPYNPAERALKIILASLYGKLAQTVGWNIKKKEPPRWHQLQWAGYITSYTRAMIWHAVQQAPDSILAVETDAVFSTVPLVLPHSEDLGDWECKTYEEITYLQNGLYYAVKSGGDVICRYRGMDRDRHTAQPVGLPFNEVICDCAKDIKTGLPNNVTVMDHLRGKSGYPNRRTPRLYTQTTRFIGLGMGLRTDKVWRSWERAERQINIDGNRYSSKRYHDPMHCPDCQASVSMWERTHPMYIGGYSGQSYARKIPWRETPQQATQDDPEEWLEMNPEFRDYGEDMDKWQ